MALDIGQTTTPTKVADYSIPAKLPDKATGLSENYWYNNNFSTYFGIYKGNAKIKNTLNTYATWCLGQGYETPNALNKTILSNITGWGEDTFNSIMWNMLVMKKVNGDAYAQIIRDKDTKQLLNLIPLNPADIRTVVNKNGRVIRYDLMVPFNDKAFTSFKPEEILHLCNDRVANEIHGVSVIEALQWNLEATEEAKRVYRKMNKNNGVVRVIEVDTSNASELARLKVEWKNAIDNGDVLLLPKDTARASDWHGNLDTQGVIAWLQYLDDDFYSCVGISKSAMGGVSDSTEASAKVGSVMFDPIYKREITELQEDLWNQLAMRITWIKQPSMMDNIQSDQAKNTGQTGFQPNDVTAGSGK